jgi:hypothetical protein
LMTGPTKVLPSTESPDGGGERLCRAAANVSAAIMALPRNPVMPLGGGDARHKSRHIIM